MKKLLFAGMLMLSVAAIRASNNDSKNGYALFGENAITRTTDWNINDTVPKDTTDTTRPHYFYGSETWNNINDTVPKDTSDTTRPH